MTNRARMSALALAVALLAAPAAALACESDSDCPGGKECKESEKGNMLCYPKEEKKESTKKGDYKKSVYRCDKTCPEVWTLCGAPVPFPCKRSPNCCYLPED